MIQYLRHYLIGIGTCTADEQSNPVMAAAGASTMERDNGEAHTTSSEKTALQKKSVTWLVRPLDGNKRVKALSYARRAVHFRMQACRHWGLLIGESALWELKKVAKRKLQVQVTISSQADRVNDRWQTLEKNFAYTTLDDKELESTATSVIRHMIKNHGTYHPRSNNCQHFVKHFADLVCEPRTQETITVEQFARIPKSKVVRSHAKDPKESSCHPPILRGDK